MKASGIELRGEKEQQREYERQAAFMEEAKELVGRMSEELGRPLFSHLTCFGCQMNVKCTTTYS